MGKKINKKEQAKRDSIIQAIEYPLITLEEFRLREAKHFARLADLKIVLHFLDDAFIEVEKYENEMRILQKWEKYVRCDGLPKPYYPPDVRLFFVKLRHFEDKNVTKTIDWLLSVDEHSILTQDIFRKDRTRKVLVKEIRPNIGLEYDKNIELGLKVLKDIEYFLDDTNVIDLIPERILEDIVEQKTIVHHEIEQFFDRFAYRILCSEDAYMDQIDAISTEYCYEAKNFEIHIWTLKNVPILFDFAETPSLIANLHTLKIELQIPFSLLEENLTIRGIHMNFDHYSEHAKSFIQKIDQPVDQLHAGITDLYQCLSFEWAMQMQITQEIRSNLIRIRLDFEERERQIAEENAKKEKERKNTDRGKPAPKKKEKPKKPKPEPPIITDDVYPDVWEDFLERDRKHNESFLNAVFHPDVLRLNEQEINLKKFMILGGIYQLYVVTKPNHTSFNSFNMTWHANNGNLHVNKDIVANLNPKRKDAEKRLTLMQSKQKKRPTAVKESKSRTQDEIMEQISRLAGPQGKETPTETKSRFGTAFQFVESEEKYTKDPELSPFFVITFDLPSYLCLWGEPIPCHFEADIIGLVETFEVRMPSFMVGDATGMSMSAAGSVGASSAVVTPRDTIDDLQPHPSAIINIFKALSTFSLRKGHTESTRELPEIEDFNLNFPMTKQQIRKLQRYCVPRIISSYRFPVEIAEEETEEARLKPKGEAGTLLRKRLSGSDDQLAKNMDRIFAFNNQNNPERMFPIFSKKESLFTPSKTEYVKLLLGQVEPETFFELIQCLDFVKKKYKTSYRVVADVPQIIQKIHVPHHRKLGSESQAKIRRHTYQLQTRRSATSVNSKVNMDDKADDKDKTNEEKEKERGRKTARHSFSKSHRYSSISRKSKKSKERQKKSEIQEAPPRETKLETFSHWTRAHIYHSIYDRESRKITIWTDRLGTIGFAYKRYVHFPFRYWSIEPSEEHPETEIVLTIDTQHARCIIYISPEGYRGIATEITTKYKKNKDIYLEINEPLNDLKELKKRFRERNVNIFSEHDARFYIENGYFSEKHLSTELHSYTCMAIHGSTIKFAFSNWNRLAQRRDIVLRFAHHKEPEDQLVVARITPEGATFVEVKEVCTDNLNEFKLEYTLTWRNIDYYADLHHCITSMYPAATDNRVKNANLITKLKNLLFEIRPISYS